MRRVRRAGAFGPAPHAAAWFASTALLLLSIPAAAQQITDPTGDIVVALPQLRAPVPLETRHKLDATAIARLDAQSADEVLRRLPSVHVPVNSRGEAIAFVRSAAERQVAIFYDGAAINVPWDNRLDLSLLPAALAGGAQVAAAPLAPHYGVNALGAVSFTAKRATNAALRAMVGSGALREGEAVVPLATGNTEGLIGGSYARRSGEPLSSNAMLPFAQTGTRRTNTDRELGSVFARASTMLDAHRLSFTAFHVAAEKGIAPEGHLPSGARFWRYQPVQHSLLAGDALLALGPSTTLDMIGWYQRFNQTIDSYTNASYIVRDAQEASRDRTVGGRLLVTQQLGAVRIIASANALESVHRQRDTAFVAGAPPATLPAFIRYQQRNRSVGLDASAAITDALTGEIGAGYDRVGYVDTGDKPAIADARGWTGRVGVALKPTDQWRLRASVGRKIRAPTMRELFGQALNRFLLNPDLRPERITSAELGAEWHSERAGVGFVGFARDLVGTIDQQNVGRLRRRINLAGSSVLGLEGTAFWHPVPEWSLGAAATYARTRRKRAPVGQTDRLAERPDVIGRFYGDYNGASGFGALAELLYTGRAYSADAAGALVALPRAASMNLRASQRVLTRPATLTVFARADNLWDVRIVPQLGLPAPGRSLRVGIIVGDL